MVSWFPDEYHHSRNCRKNTPTERPVERHEAAPPTACFRADFIFSPTPFGEQNKEAKGETVYLGTITEQLIRMQFLHFSLESLIQLGD